MNLELGLPFSPAAVSAPASQQGDASLSQWFTPSWAAELLFEHYMGTLPAGNTICEFSCGRGNFLGSIPHRYDAFGVEIDPGLAHKAATSTGRKVIVGDFREVELPANIDAFIGNPPFVADFVDGALDRMHRALRDGGKAGFLLPAYIFQTSSRVCRYNERFTIQQDLLPGKDLFPGLSYPLCFVMFTKEQKPTLINMLLFHEAAQVKALGEPARRTVVHEISKKGGVWRRAVEEALIALGGRAGISAIYEFLAPRRPTGTEWWREQVRKVLQEFFCKVGHAEYAVAAAA